MSFAGQTSSSFKGFQGYITATESASRWKISKFRSLQMCFRWALFKKTDRLGSHPFKIFGQAVIGVTHTPVVVNPIFLPS